MPPISVPAFGPTGAPIISSGRKTANKIQATLDRQNAGQAAAIARNAAKERVGVATGLVNGHFNSGGGGGSGGTIGNPSSVTGDIESYIKSALNGNIPITKEVLSMMIAAASDPSVAEANQAMTNLKSLYAARGFGTRGGGESEGIRTVRSEANKRIAASTQGAYISQAQINAQAQGQALGAGVNYVGNANQNNLGMQNLLTNWLLNYPLTTGSAAYVPQFTSPITTQANTSAVAL